MKTARRARRERGVTMIEMLIVVVIVGLLAGLTYPSIASGLDAIRLRTASDTTATFLTQAMTRVERSQQPVELLFRRGTGRLLMAGVGMPQRPVEMLLPESVTVAHVHPEPPGEPPEMVSIVLMPGGTFPALRVELLNVRGQRRLVRIDPLAGVPVVETP